MDKQLIDNLIKIVEYVNDVNNDIAYETGETIPNMPNDEFQMTLTRLQLLAIEAKFSKDV